MKRIQVVPSWSFRDSGGNQLNPQLFSLLGAIHETGKLTEATKKIGISYRHGWNLLNTWAAFFGLPLVDMQKGKGATLSALGEKLLWAEQRVLARLEPQLDSLASELNLEIHRALEGVNPLLRLHASYGYAVALLPDFSSDIQLDLQYKSAEDTLASLNRGVCDVAGFHVPANGRAGGMSDVLYETYSRHLKPRVHKIVKFITRQQGLMVKPGNPEQIAGLKDLVRNDVKFINRQKDSGTRALLDELLIREGVNSKRINGFADEEFTHSAVAAFVGAGMADVGMGVKAAASQFGLDFIPLSSEYYLFVCHHKTLKQEAMQRLLASIRSESFQAAVQQLPGYSPDDCGEIVSIDSVFTG
ncbi:MolR family transcriptional regulator [Amphritea opalescens]|uniref:MolR family transcriptional regulator n=1 Tax=Amphritea opalescens TaxID=2490544 RepID=A0A430KMN1_9GAMM|nr:substrate-binding domain-containing protein [Amphritea opalescens]RTE64706.1 MolR family transcriptional regulator [Amphritea opalescens]